MKSDIEVLEGAIALIERDGGWTQGTYCRDARGQAVEEFSSASSFCLEGAIRVASGAYDGRPSLREREETSQISNLGWLAYGLVCNWLPSDWKCLHHFNDDEHTTQDDAVLCLKRSIEFLLENPDFFN